MNDEDRVGRRAKLLEKVTARKAEVMNLLTYLDERGFMSAPSSSKASFHNAYDGGLVDHCMNVVDNLLLVNEHVADKLYLQETCVIVGLFHDCHKATDGFNRPRYVNKFLKGGGRAKDPYERNKATLTLSEGYRAAMIILQFVPLIEDEIQSICHHDGLFVPEGRVTGLDLAPLTVMIHFADMYAGILQEPTVSRLKTISSRSSTFFAKS